MKTTKFVLAFMLSFSTLLFAQQPVEITSADVPSEVGASYDLFINSELSTTVDVGEAGENKVWDLSSYEQSLFETWEVVDPAATPYIASFPDANLVYKVTSSVSDTITFNYVQISESFVAELGQAKELDGTMTFLATSAQMQAKTNFPVNYGDEPWISVPAYASSVTYLGTAVDVVAYDSSYYEVDGWGTVKTSLGDIECLRVKQCNVRNVFITNFNLWLRGIEQYIIYNWVAPNFGFVATIKSQNGETNENFTDAKEVEIMGVFRAVAVSGDKKANKSNTFQMSQNYPNPFNPNTTIHYELNKSDYVRLKIYNSKGEYIKTLIDEHQEQGAHFVDWDASDLASGIYFYEVQFDNKILRKKALLIK